MPELCARMYLCICVVFAAVLCVPHAIASLSLAGEQAVPEVDIHGYPSFSVRIKAESNGAPFLLTPENTVIVEDNRATVPLSVGAPDGAGLQTIVWRTVRVFPQPRVLVYDGAVKAEIRCALNHTSVPYRGIIGLYDEYSSRISEVNFGEVAVGQVGIRRVLLRAIKGNAGPDNTELPVRIDSITMSSPAFSFVWQGGLLPSTTPPTLIHPALSYALDLVFQPTAPGYDRCVMTVHFEGDFRVQFVLTGNMFPVETRSMLQLLAPNGGEVFSPCQEVDVRWRGANPLVETFIDYSVDDGNTWKPAGSVFDTVFHWRVPEALSNTVRVRVRQELDRSDELLPVGEDCGIYSTAFSADGKTIAGTHDNSVVIGWDTQSLGQVFRSRLRLVSERYDTVILIGKSGPFSYPYRKDMIVSTGMGFGASGMVAVCFRNIRPVISSTSVEYVSEGEDTLALFRPGTEQPLFTVPLQDTDTLKQFVVVPGGSYGVAVPEMGRRLGLYSTDDGHLIQTVDFERPVVALSISGDGNRAVVAFATGEVRTYALPAFTPETEIDCSMIPMIGAIDISADGMLIAVACRIGTAGLYDEVRGEIHVIDIASHRIIRTHRNVASDPVGLLLGATNTFLIGGFKGTPQVGMWNIPKASFEGSLNGHSTILTDMKESPDGRYIATSSPSRLDNLKIRAFSYPESDMSDTSFRIVPLIVSTLRVDVPVAIIGSESDTVITAALCNTGETPVIFDRAELAYGTAFSIEDFPAGVTLLPGSCLRIVLRLHASDTGAVADTLRAFACSSVFSVPLTAVVRDYALAMLQPMVDMGVICTGEIVERDICLLRNDDTVDVVIDRAIVIQSDGALSITPATEDVVLKPGDSLCVHVRFAPKKPGAQTAAIRVSYAGQNKIRHEIRLIGLGGGAEIASTMSHLCFLPEQPLRSLFIVNHSANIVTLTTAEMSQPGYEILTALPIELAPGDTAILAIRWDAVAQGDVALAIGAEPCGSGTSVTLAPYRGESTLSIPVVEADPRGDAAIPLIFANRAEYPYLGKRTLTAEIAVRADMFLPRTVSSSYGEATIIRNEIVNGIRLIAVRAEGDFADTGTAFTLVGSAGLADVSQTPLKLTDGAPGWSAAVPVERVDGVLQLIRTCSGRGLVAADPVVIAVYPNPAVDYVQLELGALQDGEVIVDVQDMSGRTIKRCGYHAQRGRSLHEMSLYGIAPGCYRFVVSESGRVEVVSLVVVR